MPLTMVGIGETTVIKRIKGTDETRKFLKSLGFVMGAYVTVISDIAGNMILKIKDTRIALDKSMVNRILV
ncbi:FeoA family protein [Clostridium sp.]|uniref:FeoA family protein n=1 Tax=Clostridium sp. TaxID=1506 RepID=UPI003216EE3A